MTPGEWQAVRHLFDACLDTSPESRAKVLAEADVPERVRTETARLLNNLDRAGDSFLQAPEGVKEVLRGEEFREPKHLAVGECLGPYEIVALIGAGGMGEVYKARDTRLDRIVAIKVSAARFTERFEREARAVAALNHPNICQLYDVGPDYIVLEHVDGSPVAPTDSIRKLMNVAVQLADGMAAAHSAGFVHRDLKPSNVLVTAEGRVKILDFGLVKVVAKPDDAGSTQAITLTATGVVAGTAAYMSPEQASGSTNLDARSDQFSCGLMLYEMASGKRAFKRLTAAETLTAIIREDPEPLPASVPAPLRWIIHRCLSKEPRDRYESSRDLYLELRSLRENLSDASSSTAIPALTAPPKRRRPWSALLVFAAGVALTAGIALLLRPTPSPRGALRFTPFSSEEGGQLYPVWSPNGKAVAFAARQKETDPYQVYVRYLDSPVPAQITHIAEDALPLDWTSSDRIIFRSGRQPAGLWSVSPVGSEPEPFQARATPAASVSPDGAAVAWPRKGDDGVFGVWISSPPGSAPKAYAPAPFASRNVFNDPRVKFSPDGKQILFIRNAGASEEIWLMPYPPNPAKPPHRILENFPAFGGTPMFSWMPDNRHGVIATLSALGVAPQLYLADTVSGQFDVLSSGTRPQVSPAVSPDGTKLIFLESSGDFDIVSVDLATAAITPVITTQRSEQMPAWASKEAAMVYVTDRSGSPEIWLHKLGQPDRPLVTARDFPQDTTQWFVAPSLSPDASRVLYTRVERAGTARLWMSAVTGGGPVRVVKSDTDIEYPGSWSPDGNWFVYSAVKDGKISLNKVKSTGRAEPEVLKVDVKPLANWVPLWSPAGDWIVYPDAGAKLISPDGKTMRDLASKDAVAFAFAADGKTLYGIRQVALGRPELFSVRVAGGAEKTIGSLGREYLPASQVSPSLRLSLNPDGKSVTYSTVKWTNNLWLMDGLSSVR